MTCNSKRALLLGALPFMAMAQPAQADIVIGPRFSYYFDNSNLRTSNQTSFYEVGADRVSEIEELFEQNQNISPTIISEDPSSSVLADQIAFPMYGAMINFGDDLSNAGNGLAQLGNLRGLSAVVFFSTEPGIVAEDGDTPGLGTPFAKEFSGQIARRQSLDEVFRRTAVVANAVTDGRQSPRRQGDLPFNVFVAGMRALPIP